MIFPTRFIKAGEVYNTFENHIPAPYFRKTFTLSAPAQGELLITACGFYELYINGEHITKGALAPYICNPDDLVYYDRYTVSLTAGKNVIAVLLGNGFQNNPGGYIWDFDTAAFRGAPRLALSLSYGDTVLETGEDFKTAPSPILFDDYRFGEQYDANLELPGWNTADFDDSAWQNAMLADAPKGEKRLCESDPIVAGEEIQPKEIIPIDGAYLYDFGVNHTGVCRLVVNGQKGQRIELQHAEQVLDGKLDVASVWFVRDFWERDRHIVHQDVYICKGGATEMYMPTFTYHGFRYVKVSGITAEQATKDLLTFVTLHSDIKTCGGFSTSEPTVQALQEITVRSDLSNFHYFPTDCPHREKNGWTADAALSSEQMLLNFTVAGNYREWLRNICQAQAENGALPGIVPTGGWGFDWGNGPAWDSVLFYLPYYAYRYRGDRQIVSESADAMLRYLQYIEGRTDENGLLAIGLGDWCHVGRDPEQPKAPLVLTDSIVSMDLARKAAFLFGELGLAEQKAYAETLMNRYRAAIRKHLINADTLMAAGDCQSSQAMALYYGVFEKDEESAAFENLLTMIHEAGDHMDVGVLGGRVLFHVLSDFAQSDLALRMIIRPDFPSYGNWLARGATTLWEMMLKEEVGYSKNHHFWGDISAWFIKRLAGICYNPGASDLASVDICPNFPSAMQDASAYFESEKGKIESAWKRTGNGILLCVTVPAGMTGEIILPKGAAFSDGTRRKPVASGNYEIICQ